MKENFDEKWSYLMAARTRIMDIPKQDEEQNLRCAEDLVRYMGKKFYPEIAQFRPLSGDMFGLLSQISNMVIRLRRELTVEPPKGGF